MVQGFVQALVRIFIADILADNVYGDFIDKGLVISGRSPDGKFVEAFELPEHPWFVAVQFHPEFQSKPRNPHPLFDHFVKATYDHRQSTKPASETMA